MPVAGFPLEYVPDVVQSWEELGRELLRVQSAIQQQAVVSVSYTKLFAAPARPYDGLVVMADGATWNPGAGQGLYIYYGAAWHLLG